MAYRFLRNVQKEGREQSDFPIICQSCFGGNPSVRMIRAEDDKECKICTRPFTVFRWRPGRDARYKKTEICQTCCKVKNVCQVCLLDLEYGLPVQVRDTVLSINSNDAIPKSDLNRVYFAEEHDRRARAGIDYDSSYGKVQASDTILKLQRTTPYYKRNRAHICSFFVRGECKRGAECPYRHEMPKTGELSRKNYKDRFNGVNDPVALKLLNRAGKMPVLPAVAHTGLFPRAVQNQIQPHGTETNKRAYYPSMDPQRMGAAVVSKERGVLVRERVILTRVCRLNIGRIPLMCH